MLEVLGETYYVDFLQLEENINIPKSDVKTVKVEGDELVDDDTQHISIVKYETIKMMLEVILTERDDMDEI